MITLKSKSTDNDWSSTCRSCGETCWVTNIPETTDWICWSCNAYVVTVIGTDQSRRNSEGHFEPLWCRMYAMTKDIITTVEEVEDDD